MSKGISSSFHGTSLDETIQMPVDGCTVVPPFGLSSDYNLPVTDEGLEGRRARGSTVGSGAPAP